MTLSNAQSAAYTKLRRTSSSGQAVELTDDNIRGLLYLAVRDLGLEDSYSLPSLSPGLYDPEFAATVEIPGDDPKRIYEYLLGVNPEVETYVACAAAILKARLKYQRVLYSQPMATMDQVAPRGLLQFGQLDSHSLASLLVWRKWFYDIDNRAAQDTGYLFEPVIAGAIGGVPYSSRKSPVKRKSGVGGRQIDCLKGDRAYEIKIRITIAASGQGRWKEEIDFPEEAKMSGLVPVLLVLDPTPNVKLSELITAFESNGGEAFIGDSAWDHLKAEAGPEMGVFLEKYIREPLNDIYLAPDEDEPLPSFSVTDHGSKLEFLIGDSRFEVDREVRRDLDDSHGASDLIPDEGGDFLPGMEF